MLYNFAKIYVLFDVQWFKINYETYYIVFGHSFASTFSKQDTRVIAVHIAKNC